MAAVLTLDDGLLPDINHDVDLDAEADRREKLLQVLQEKWPTEIRGNIMYYMAGWCARAVARCTKCVDCRESLFSEIF